MVELTETECIVLCMRFGLNGGTPRRRLWEIAKELHTSLGRTRLIQDEAIRKLRVGQGEHAIR